MDVDEVLWPTGRMERFNITRNALHMYNTVHVSALYTIPSTSLHKLFTSSSPNTETFQAIISSCLTEVLKTQPILGVTIHDEASNTPTYRRLKAIDFTQIVKVIEQDPEACPDALLQAGLRERLDRVDELPVWRIIVAIKYSSLSSPVSSGLKFTIALFAHHAIADGLSCGAFHATFLEALNTHITSSLTVSSTSTVPVHNVPLVHSLEENANLPLTLWFLIIVLIKEYIYNPTDKLAWSGAPVTSTVPTTPPLVSLRSFSLPAAQVAALVQKCRDEKTTVTSLMLVIVARKLGQMYPEHKHFTAGMPFSMRKFTGHGPRDMGVFVSSVPSYFASEEKTPMGFVSCFISSTARDSKIDGDENGVWDSARKTKDHIRAKTSSPKNQMVTMLKFADDYKPFFLKKLGGKRESAFEITNITTIDGGLGEAGNRKAYFDRALFCGGLSQYAAPYVISVVSVKGGQMNVCVTWEEGVVTEKEVGILTEGLEEGLRKCSGAWEM